MTLEPVNDLFAVEKTDSLMEETAFADVFWTAIVTAKPDDSLSLISEGDMIVFQCTSLIEIPLKSGTVTMIREKDIMGVIKDMPEGEE